MANYILKIIHFECSDESGIDRLGSDEVLWVFSAFDPAGGVNTTRSKKFGNVDSGDAFWFKFADEPDIVWPKAGDKNGAPGPIGLSIQLWENDQGNPDQIAKATQAALIVAGATVAPAWVAAVPPIVQDKLNNLIADDLMGSISLLYSESRLRKSLPNVGDKLKQKQFFGGRGGDLPFEVAGGPDYYLHYEVIRVA